MSVVNDYEKAVESTCAQIEKDTVVIKPYLINFIRYELRKLTEKDANEIIKKMVTEGIIDEYLALSKVGKPYPFYVTASRQTSF